MKNTYLIAVLFLIVGLIGGQFLNLNISDQEGSVIKKGENAVDFKIKDKKTIINKDGVEIPIINGSNNRPYLCSSSLGITYEDLPDTWPNNVGFTFQGITYDCAGMDLVAINK